MAFKKAQKTQSKLRFAIMGPSGSGKTYSALAIASALVPGGRIAVIDSERGSASKYADKFDFDVCELETFSMKTYMQSIHDAEAAGYDVLIIDSLSHVWSGQGGAIEAKEHAEAKMKNPNGFSAWREITPEWNRLLDTITGAKLHVVGTMRSKTEYSLEKDDRGKVTPRKIGMAPIFRDQGEYEFDVVGEMNLEHDLIITKTRCDTLDGRVFNKPGEDVGATLRAWLSDGVKATPKPDELPERDRIENRVRELYANLNLDPEAAITKLRSTPFVGWSAALEKIEVWHDQKARTELIKLVRVGFGDQGWDEDDIKRYLKDYNVQSVESLGIDQLNAMLIDLGMSTAERSVA